MVSGSMVRIRLSRSDRTSRSSGWVVRDIGLMIHNRLSVCSFESTMDLVKMTSTIDCECCLPADILL